MCHSASDRISVGVTAATEYQTNNSTGMAGLVHRSPLLGHVKKFKKVVHRSPLLGHVKKFKKVSSKCDDNRCLLKNNKARESFA